MFPDMKLFVACSCALLVVPEAGALAAGDDGATKGYIPAYTLVPQTEAAMARITLTESAISRLGVETAEVTSVKAARTIVTGGRVVDESQIASADSNSTVGLATKWVLLPLTEDIAGSITAPVMVRILNGGSSADGVQATPDASRNVGVTEETGGTLYYSLDDSAIGFSPGAVVLVEVPYVRNGLDHSTVPYSSIIYDKNGDEWVYESPEPGVYFRTAIDIAYITDNQVFLIEGPAVGTKVVTVGSAELLGIEYKIGH